jgi:hypothetical protein
MGPLEVHAPPGWQLRFSVENEIPRYYISSPDNRSQLTLSRPQQTVKPADIPMTMTNMAQGFGMMITNSRGFKLNGGPVTVQTLTGAQFHGSYVVARVQQGQVEVTHATLMLSDGGLIWGGQFIGTADGWLKAMEVLQTLRNGAP